MPQFVAEVIITLKSSINDPQGLVTGASLHKLGFTDVGSVRIGKQIELEVSAESAEVARARVTSMCDALLCNPVIERYRVDIRTGAGAAP